MRVKERIIQSVQLDRLDEFQNFQRKLNVAEARLGFPPLRWYHSLYGEEDSWTVVGEREWESLAALAATYANAEADEERKSIMNKWIEFGTSHRQELWEDLTEWVNG